MDKPKHIRVKMASNANKKYNHHDIITQYRSGKSINELMHQFNIPDASTIRYIVKKSIQSKI